MFSDMGRQQVCLAVQKVQVSPVEEKKRSRERRKAKEDSKEKEEHSLVKNKKRILNGSHKKIVFGGPKEEEARRVRRKVKIDSLKMVVALTNKKIVQAVISIRTQAEARTGKDKAKKVLILNMVFQPLKHPKTKEMASPGNQIIGIPDSLTILVPLLHGMALDTLHGWHQSL